MIIREKQVLELMYFVHLFSSEISSGIENGTCNNNARKWMENMDALLINIIDQQSEELKEVK